MSISRLKDMNILEEVKELLASQDNQEIGEKLDLLSDVFEYGHDLNEEDVVEGTRLLLPAALQEKDEWTKESFFHTISNAVVWQNIGDRINWDILVASLPSLEKTLLGYAFNMLGFSGQEKYSHILNTYTHHPDPEIKKWARDATLDLQNSLAPSPDSPEE